MISIRWRLSSFNHVVVACTVAFAVAGCGGVNAPASSQAQNADALLTSNSSSCGGDFGMLGEIENDQRGWWDGLEYPTRFCNARPEHAGG